MSTDQLAYDVNPEVAAAAADAAEYDHDLVPIVPTEGNTNVRYAWCRPIGLPYAYADALGDSERTVASRSFMISDGLSGRRPRDMISRPAVITDSDGGCAVSVE